MATAIEAGIPKLRIEEAAARTQARIDSGRQPVDRRQHVPARHGRRRSTCSRSTTPRCATQQLAKLERLRAERDEAACDDALDALTAAAAVGRRRRGARAGQNLLALAIDAARAQATVGEISDALEKVFGRHTAAIRTISGVYRNEVGEAPNVEPRCARSSTRSPTAEGRRPRILVAKMGQDGHDRGQKVIATAFADLGFDVDVGPLFQTPAEVARQAVEADVHVVGVSSLAAGHLTLVPAADATRSPTLGPRRHHDRRRRRDPAAGLRRAARGRRGGDLPARHGHRRRRRRRCSTSSRDARRRADARRADRPRRLRATASVARRPRDARPGDHARRVDPAATTSDAGRRSC